MELRIPVKILVVILHFNGNNVVERGLTWPGYRISLICPRGQIFQCPAEFIGRSSMYILVSHLYQTDRAARIDFGILPGVFGYAAFGTLYLLS